MNIITNKVIITMPVNPTPRNNNVKNIAKHTQHLAGVNHLIHAKFLIFCNHGKQPNNPPFPLLLLIKPSIKYYYYYLIYVIVFFLLLLK